MLAEAEKSRLSFGHTFGTLAMRGRRTWPQEGGVHRHLSQIPSLIRQVCISIWKAMLRWVPDQQGTVMAAYGWDDPPCVHDMNPPIERVSRRTHIRRLLRHHASDRAHTRQREAGDVSGTCGVRDPMRCSLFCAPVRLTVWWRVQLLASHASVAEDTDRRATLVAVWQINTIP